MALAKPPGRRSGPDPSHTERPSAGIHAAHVRRGTDHSARGILHGSAGLVEVAINGSIVVLAAIRANPRARAGGHDAIVEETMRPTLHIVSTTLITIGGSVPLLASGSDFWPPLAVVIAGGVGFSMTLGLFFTPATYTPWAAGWISAGAPTRRHWKGSLSRRRRRDGRARLHGVALANRIICRGVCPNRHGGKGCLLFLNDRIRINRL